MDNLLMNEQEVIKMERRFNKKIRSIDKEEDLIKIGEKFL